MVSSPASPRRGDRVIVDWGLDTIEAEVQDVYSSGLGTRVVLRVPVLGPSGEELDHNVVTVPVASIQQVLS